MEAHPGEVTGLGGLTVRHAAASVRQVRRWLVAELDRLGLPGDVIDDAALLVTELVGNAVQYALPLPGGVLRVTWDCVSDRLLLRVTDGDGPARPLLRNAGRFDTRGRGLAIVDAVAAAWGIERGRFGGASSTVWAELRTAPRGLPPRLGA
jgi:anti-sigma regulatory factor (Ser/Thr protein kinase)